MNFYQKKQTKKITAVTRPVTCQAFNDVKSACFGSVLDADYADKIQAFKRLFEQLKVQFGVRETPKLHIINTHILQFIQWTGKPLGPYSEQSTESVHRFAHYYQVI